MSAFKTPYLVTRGHRFYFRRAVSSSLISRLGRREIKVSLGEIDARQARRLCRELTNRYEALIDMVKESPQLTKDVINGLVRHYFRVELENIDELVELFVPEDDQFDVDAEIEGATNEIADMKQRIVRSKFTTQELNSALQLIAHNGYAKPARASEEFESVCRGILRAEMEKRRILIAKLQGDYDDVEPKDAIFKVPAIYNPESEGDHLSLTVQELADAYINEKVSGGRWKHRTLGENKRILGYFVQVATPKRPAQLLQTDDVRRFKDLSAELRTFEFVSCDD